MLCKFSVVSYSLGSICVASIDPHSAAACVYRGPGDQDSSPVVIIKFFKPYRFFTGLSSMKTMSFMDLLDRNNLPVIVIH